MLDRYGDAAPLRPLYTDTFIGRGGLWGFHSEGGRVASMSFKQGRVWDLRFERVR